MPVKIEHRDKTINRAWNKHARHWKRCQACPLHCHRQSVCLLTGALPCDLLFIGIGPGRSEDTIGEPFVGPAGERLREWIGTAQEPLSFRWALTNLVACRPCDGPNEPNRDPTSREITRCRPRLLELIPMSKCNGLVFVGRLPEQEAPTRWQLPDITLRHPANVLRMSNAGQAAENDLAERKIKTLVHFLHTYDEKERKKTGCKK